MGKPALGYLVPAGRVTLSGDPDLASHGLTHLSPSGPKQMSLCSHCPHVVLKPHPRRATHPTHDRAEGAGATTQGPPQCLSAPHKVYATAGAITAGTA